MPEPTRFSKRRKKPEDDGSEIVPVVSAEIVESRCHVCKSQYRRAIDKMLALGTSYSEISRVFGGEIDRRSISNHDKEHLNYEDAAIRRIIEHEIHEAQENLEEGIQGAVARRVYLKTAMHKALVSLLADEATVEVKDALAIAQYLDKLEAQTAGAQVAEVQLQFNAFVTAMKELCHPDLWMAILDRTKQIVGVSMDPRKQIGSSDSEA